MRHTMKIGKEKIITYGLHEVYYNGKKLSWTEEAVTGHWENKEQLINSLGMMLKDAKKRRPILTYKV